MPIDTGELTNTLVTAGRALPGNIWARIHDFSLPELEKIAEQIKEIVENADQFTPAGARDLLELQVTASVGVIVAATQLVEQDVQDAINAILAAVRDFVNGRLPFPLL